MGFALDNRTPVGSYQQANIISSASKRLTDLVGMIPEGANVCLIQVDEANNLGNSDIAIRYREDAVAPTSVYGFVMGKGDYRELTNRSQIDDIRFISPESTSVTVNIQFYKA
jgi:hypothetical protein